ncbi:MarR family winged helix-turn-helix transcriptional regulator [Streptomyces sp. NBC_00691]|uniref:MarR family winged helix-turn-helix transcriptional regulator n=1 Tax=Streptomyces sp. NBC_00691 TaxID=2903671 RepID=UPI002E2F3F42|nr:MarR family winged helix-turn-helix transcriptional regulator [Streptomyces sp. NBC_00691]
MTTTSTTAPRANGRVLALAHHAGRVLLEGVLTRHGITFHQSVTLRAVAVAGESVGRDELVGDVTGSLKTDASVVTGVIEELTAAKLLEADPAEADRVRLTDAGRTSYETTTAESAEIAARLYEGIPDEDLVITGRVLTLITDRANAELAAGA